MASHDQNPRSQCGMMWVQPGYRWGCVAQRLQGSCFGGRGGRSGDVRRGLGGHGSQSEGFFRHVWKCGTHQGLLEEDGWCYHNPARATRLGYEISLEYLRLPTPTNRGAGCSAIGYSATPPRRENPRKQSAARHLNNQLTALSHVTRWFPM